MRGLLSLIVLVGLSTVATAGPPTITVHGVGKSQTKPNEATISAQVVCQRASSTEAMAHCTKSVRSIFAAMNAMGIANDDIATTGVNISDWEKVDGNGNRTKLGNTVSYSMTVQVRDLQKVGPAIDKLSEFSDVRLEGIQFGTSLRSAMQAKARKAAVEDAREKALAFLAPLGVKLGSIVSINDPGNSPYRPIIANRMMMVAGAADASLPISGGDLTFTDSVTIVWEVLPAEHVRNPLEAVNNPVAPGSVSRKPPSR